MAKADVASIAQFRWRAETEAKAHGRAEVHTMRRGKEVFALVRKHRSGGWFWYTAPGLDYVPYRNTASRPVPDLTAAMQDASAHVRSALAARALPGSTP